MALPAPPVYGMLLEWYSRTLPALATTPCRWLAKLVCALSASGVCTEPALATALQRLGLTATPSDSAQVAIRRCLSDPRLTVATAYVPLVRRTLARWPAPVLLVIVDATTLKDRLWRLQLSVAYHGRALPVAWVVYPSSGVPAGSDWKTLFHELLRTAALALPPPVPVLVLLDRGFVSPALWDAVRAHGWHPVLRATRQVRLRTPDGQVQAVGAVLGAQPGLATLAGTVFKKGGWRPASVTAVRRDGHPEAWLLLSDLPAAEQRVLEYAVRMHIEESFRDDKSRGWQWEQSRITDPERASRLLLVLHLATLWCLSLGATAVDQGLARRWVRLRRPAWSLFQIGWAWLREALARRTLVPLHHRLPHLPAWPTPLCITAPFQT